MGTMSGPRVLIADDDPWIRESATFLLRDEGYETVEASTGTEVMDLVLSSPTPLLVLLDLVMPAMTGFEVLSLVEARAELAARHRFIVFSARPYRLAIQIGPNFASLLERLEIPFVEKPFEIDEFMRMVRATYARLLPPDRRLDTPHTA